MGNVTGRSWPTKRAPDGYATPTNAGTPTTQAWPKARDSAAGTAAMDILADAVFRIDAADHQRSGAPAKVVRNLGTGGSVLDCRTGSTSVPDTNDPLFLPVQDRAYVYLPGIAGNDMSFPHVAGAQVGDDVDVRLDIAPETWNPSATVGLAGKGTSTASAATYCWTIFLNTSSRILAQYSDGTNTITYNSATGLSGLVANQRTRLRIRYVRNTGSGQYAITLEQSTDFTTALADITSWTVLNTQTGASIGAMTDVANPTFIGTYRASSASVPGKFYEFALLVNGSSVASVDTSVLTTGSATSFTAVTGQTVTINRSTSGRKTVVVPSADRKLVDAGNVYLPGVANNYMSVPHESAFNVTNLDLSIRMNGDSYRTTTGEYVLASKDAGGSSRSFYWSFDASGKMNLYWWTTGGTLVQAITTSAVSVIAGTAYWFRATLQVNNGAGNYVWAFYVAPDSGTEPSSWTTIETKTVAGTTSIRQTTAALFVGANSATYGHCVGRFYRFKMLSDIAGTTVLDIDTSVAPTNFTPGYASAFPAVTGQTVTLNSTAGSAMRVNGERWASGGPVWLFGTDDYMEVPNSTTGSKAVDFTNNDSFTVMAVIRQWATPVSFQFIINKFNNATPNIGWWLYNYITNAQTYAQIGDKAGTSNSSGTLSYVYGNSTVLAAVIDRQTALIRHVSNQTANAGARITVGDTTLNVPMRIARSSTGGSGGSDFEFMAASVWRRALSAAEISTLTTYYQSRWS